MLRGRDVLTILDFTREELEELFSTADDVLKRPERYRNVLEGYVLATAFFEPSTRTRLSFQAAMLRLGGSYIDLAEAQRTSLAKGENFADTIRMLDAYADVIVVRHRIEGAAKFAAEVASSPVINAGDGTRHHPTQAMIDLYSIRRFHGRINGLVIGVLGDLKYGRAASSLIYGVSLYRIAKLYLIAPRPLRARSEVKEYLEARGVRYEEVESVEEVLPELDVLYVTRIQRERIPDPTEYERVRGSYRITRKLLERHAKDDLVVLHPLPRVDEISPDVDYTPHAKYFEQASLGVPVRMALLKLILRG